MITPYPIKITALYQSKMNRSIALPQLTKEDYFMNKMMIIIASLCFTSQAFARKCQFIGVNAKCGNASELVKCDGYKFAYHMANNQEVTKFNFNALIKVPGLATKKIEDILTISSPGATAGEYYSLARKYSTEILKETIQENEESASQAFLELEILLLESQLPEDFVIGRDLIRAGNFELSDEAKLYTNCNVEQGVAPLLENEELN